MLEVLSERKWTLKLYMFWLLDETISPRSLLRQLNWSSWSCHPILMLFWWQSACSMFSKLVPSTLTLEVYRSRAYMLHKASRHASYNSPHLSYFIEPKQAYNLYANTTDLCMSAKSGRGRTLLLNVTHMLNCHSKHQTKGIVTLTIMGLVGQTKV